MERQFGVTEIFDGVWMEKERKNGCWKEGIKERRNSVGKERQNRSHKVEKTSKEENKERNWK